MTDQTPSPDPQPSDPAAPARKEKIKSLVKRFGVAGFLFFFIKGLLWLLIPLVIALGWFGK